MFIRKRNPAAWKRFNQENKAPARSKASHSDDSEHDSDSPRPRKQKKKSGDTAQAKINRLMSETLSSDSDSDSDILVIGNASTPNGKSRRKRRSRSRSLTPPPVVSRQQVQIAKDLARKALEAQLGTREPSPPPDANDSTDTIILDPEVQAIIQRAAGEAKRSFSEPVESEETIQITVKWIPHPLNESGKQHESAFKLNRTDNFRDLFDAVADDEGILADTLVMTYNGGKLFPIVTPASLDLWGEAGFVACNNSTWEYMRANPTAFANSASSSNFDAAAASDDSDGEPVLITSNTQQNTQESDAESDAGGETFKLVLQSAATKNITVTVRPTTTCGAIVQAFLKKAGLADKFKQSPRKSIGGSKKGKKAPDQPQLVIDGDKMAPHVPIGDMDLDDGDTVDVVGL
ncbi:hypothetical protein R3P38DRAFT_2870148 [Favolaschia claudopus]|uniref:Rad60/SUMO-like domain-containing protein n=1 Tax=Favolaschia claudopus TaxID=2862362 RepID=A0AAW0D7S4_9AGAR